MTIQIQIHIRKEVYALPYVNTVNVSVIMIPRAGKCYTMSFGPTLFISYYVCYVQTEYVAITFNYLSRVVVFNS